MPEFSSSVPIACLLEQLLLAHPLSSLGNQHDARAGAAHTSTVRQTVARKARYIAQTLHSCAVAAWRGCTRSSWGGHGEDWRPLQGCWQTSPLGQRSPMPSRRPSASHGFVARCFRTFLASTAPGSPAGLARVYARAFTSKHSKEPRDPPPCDRAAADVSGEMPGAGHGLGLALFSRSIGGRGKIPPPAVIDVPAPYTAAPARTSMFLVSSCLVRGTTQRVPAMSGVFAGKSAV
jgi:hypothetical protein